MIDHHIKSGAGAASIRGIKPEMCIAHTLIVALFTRHGIASRLSSGTDSKHSRASLHYVGYALDISFRGVPQKLIDLLHAELKAVLGDEFDVVKEKTHFHIEFQPKGPLNE
ncbi:MAG TPA: hypothetical protein ENI94_12865 [Gammaproteobacteria bacterium]|nr:hypothetical protein [Gammaproteobacteria bacterium]